MSEGVAQAKNYAEKLKLDTSYASNGKEIYQICMKTGEEGLIAGFPAPDELWNKTFATQNQWRDKFNQVPFEDVGGTKSARYYQEIAVNNTMAAIAEDKQRILLTMATGTGKTFIAFQIAWKLFQTRWNLKRDGSRRPRILFLADRNILADQAFNAFSAFPEDALVRINPKEIGKKGGVPTNGSIFFTIFQTFMSDPDDQPYFGEYPADYFDFIIIDECHRGGANDEGNWRGIMEYFSPAVQLGLTATPKRKDNADTYKYFGEPVYIYSLKEGINDGFLTPFKVKRIKTTLDDYIYTSDDQIIEGEIEEGKIYTEPDFNRIIEIKERESRRVQIFLSEINQNEKAIVFCATQDYALAVRDLVNQFKKSKEPNYCARVTANDGAMGEQYLREFQDNEKTIPTILTTSQKLSTGVDARNIRNIILMRPVNSMIEFKQIVGRGTRPFDGKEFLQNMFGKLPDFFKSEDELRKVWSNPITRKILLEKLADAGYGKGELTTLQKLINAEKSDLFDVLEYVSFAVKPITREARVAKAQSNIFALLNNKQKEFLEFVLSKYIETGVEELDQEKLPELLTLKYHALDDAKEMLGSVENIRTIFIDFQKYLYERKTA